MGVANNARSSAKSNANADNSADGGKGEESARWEGVEIRSEKALGDFGSRDEEHLRGVLVVDGGKPIWNRTPLKPLIEWTVEETKKAREAYRFTVMTDSLPLDRERHESRAASCKSGKLWEHVEARIDHYRFPPTRPFLH
eukprot:GEMP01058150.1.p1 GENE.GEMP01058150.1~~GEMP01058150.1.p1  ORF type:complete len:140 (+),score=32.53 GEMP01058150.1:245-664(+)